MNDTQLVSIIIPTYKSGDTLKLAIESALNQTYQNIEVIVVDDNNPNTDFRIKTEIVMKNYEDNPKVKYIKHEKNKNGSAARNTGFRTSKGNYICFLDDDDVFLERKIEKQVKFLQENTQYMAVYTWRYQHGKVISYTKSGDLSEELLLLSFTPYTSSIMIKRESYVYINGFDESYTRHQDYEFLLRFFEYYPIGVIEEPLIEIKGNGIDNALHGNKLEELKSQFLSQFNPHIERINEERKGFKKLVYARHYSTVFWDYLARKKIKHAKNILVKYTSMCGIVFWKCLYNVFIVRAKVKVTRFLGISRMKMVD